MRQKLAGRNTPEVMAFGGILRRKDSKSWRKAVIRMTNAWRRLVGIWGMSERILRCITSSAYFPIGRTKKVDSRGDLEA